MVLSEAEKQKLIAVLEKSMVNYNISLLKSIGYYHLIPSYINRHCITGIVPI